MLGWKLFVRAVTLLTDNLPAALRISLVPYALIVAADAWLASTWPEVTTTALSPDNPPPADFAFAALATLALNLVISLWVAVAWHRYTLRGEASAGWLPPIHGGAILTYLGKSIGIGLVVAAAFLIVGIVAAPFATLFGVAAVQTVIPVAGFFIGMILFYRLGLVLPAASLGTPMTFGEAWRVTNGLTQVTIVLAMLTVAATLVLQVPTVLDGGGGAITFVYQAVVGWIALMLGVGTLSALYGHVVEGWSVD